MEAPAGVAVVLIGRRLRCRLLAALDHGPLSRNTIIVLWPDHGYHLGHKKHWEKFALWEQTTRVPLIFADTRKDGFRPGATHQPVSLIDVYPTLIDLCQLDRPNHLGGTSLVPLIRNPAMITDRAIVTTHRKGNHAVKSEHWRYIRYADGSEELYDHHGFDELYDLKKDPNEFTNLASKPEFSETKLQLANWLPKEEAESAFPIKKLQK